MTLAMEISTLYPWLPAALAEIYMEEYVESGDADLAWASMQASPEYDIHFPGNRRDDGTLRYDEQTYYGIREDYRDTIRTLGIDPSLFEERYIAMLAGNVKPTEFFTRVNGVVSRVVNAQAEISAAYRDQWGIDFTTEALIASVLDPNLGDQLLNRQITMAEIAGAGAVRGFGVNFDLAAQLFSADVDEAQAEALVGAAARPQEAPAIEP